MSKIKLHIKFCFLLICFSVFCYQKCFSQNIYSNIDFENGNFSGWNAATGSCCPIEIQNNGFISNRHTIMTGNAFDPYSLGQIPVVAPGGNYSVRLGNDSIGSQAEKLAYTFTVLPEASLFVYRYAVVFHFPPNHPVVKQPRFEISVMDQNQTLIDCGFYLVTCPNNIPGFVTNGDYRFKTWTDVGVDLTDFIGQQITIEFATGDCGMGGHFGYAYIDCYATELKITGSGCNPDGSIILTGPPGFNYNWQNGETTQQITLNNANGGSEISLTLSAVTGCDKTISYVVPDYVPKADFSFEQNCDFEISFTDQSSVSNANIISWNWDFGNGSFSTSENPIEQFSLPGNFPVTLTVSADNNCKSSVTIPLEVEKPLKAEFDFISKSPNGKFCVGDEILFSDHSQSFNGTIASWLWNFTDNTNSNLKNPSHIFRIAGINTVSLLVENDNGCTDTISKTIFIEECDDGFSLFVPNSFSPNDDGVNDEFILSAQNATETEMEIYNRWGQKIFNNSGNTISWKGTDAYGAVLQEDVYSYQISVSDMTGKRHYYTGNIALLR